MKLAWHVENCAWWSPSVVVTLARFESQTRGDQIDGPHNKKPCAALAQGFGRQGQPQPPSMMVSRVRCCARQ
jgi:hypothetical protein